MVQRLILMSVFALSPCLFAVAQEADSSADVTAIRKMVDSYVEAFNRGDADAVASHWSKDGRYFAPDGEPLTGPEAIAEAFKKSFAETPEVRVEVLECDIRVVAEDRAIEQGTAQSSAPDEETFTSAYLAEYVKEDGSWKLVSIDERDPEALSHFEQLAPVAWLIGEWVDEDGESKIDTVCRWTKNGNFMTRSFAVSLGGEISLEGTQVIGWDAEREQIRSWLFDSEGGVGDGLWTDEGDHWTIRSRQVLADGSVASSINILTPVDENSFTWQSVGREVDGAMQPNVGPVTVVRKPQ